MDTGLAGIRIPMLLQLYPHRSMGFALRFDISEKGDDAGSERGTVIADTS